MKIFIGWDPRDDLAYKVCAKSIQDNSSIDLDIIPLKLHELREGGLYYRSHRVDGNGQKWDDIDGKPFSTDFSFSRFCVPSYCGHEYESVLFCDPDMMWLGDVAELDQYLSNRAVACVKHEHVAEEGEKALGIQTNYYRKNWSSLMLFNPALCPRLNKEAANRKEGSWLHAMKWVDDPMIGSIPKEWNMLAGVDEIKDPKVIHYTLGTPDMEGYEDSPLADLWWKYARS
tara:strand:- start:1628 stop:2314 length:687 start_codon:yes stop_codon:yes gene_type:complete